MMSPQFSPVSHPRNTKGSRVSVNVPSVSVNSLDVNVESHLLQQKSLYFPYLLRDPSSEKNKILTTNSKERPTFTLFIQVLPFTRVR